MISSVNDPRTETFNGFLPLLVIGIHLQITFQVVTETTAILKDRRVVIGQISLSQVNKALKTMEEDSIICRRGRIICLRDADSLLASLKKNHKRRKVVKRLYVTKAMGYWYSANNQFPE